MRGDAIGRRLLAAVMALPLLGAPIGSTPVPARIDDPSVSIAPRAVAQKPRRLFISGHSLTDRPFPDYLAALVAARGSVLDWDQQQLFGSSLRDRTRGPDGKDSGYRAGLDRQGWPADVLYALATGPVRYDALLLAEQHSLLESLLWKDMVPSAADYIARFRAASPAGHTYLFASWLNVDDLGDPSRWIAYERAADRAWQCAASRIGAVAGAPVTIVPAAAALALLVEQANSGRLPGIGLSAAQGATTAIFADDVHLAPAGIYYVALVTHGILFGELPAAAWIPPGLLPKDAAALGRVARGFLGRYSPDQAASDPAACRAYLGGRFAGQYLDYVRDARWQREQGVAAHLRWVRFRLSWPRLLRGTSPANPFATPPPA